MRDDAVADEIMRAFDFDVVHVFLGDSFDGADCGPFKDFFSHIIFCALFLRIFLCYTIYVMNKRITINADVRFGKPTIRGTRIAVADILNLLRAGYALDEIPGQYEGITKEDVDAAIEFAI